MNDLTIVYIIFGNLVQVQHGWIWQCSRQPSGSIEGFHQRRSWNILLWSRPLRVLGSLWGIILVALIWIPLHPSTNRHAFDPPEWSFVKAFHSGLGAFGAWTSWQVALDAPVATCPAWIHVSIRDIESPGIDDWSDPHWTWWAADWAWAGSEAGYWRRRCIRIFTITSVFGGIWVEWIKQLSESCYYERDDVNIHCISSTAAYSQRVLHGKPARLLQPL